MNSSMKSKFKSNNTLKQNGLWGYKEERSRWNLQSFEERTRVNDFWSFYIFFFPSFIFLEQEVILHLRKFGVHNPRDWKKDEASQQET